MARKTKPCPMAGCWQAIGLKRALCVACASWWSRVSLKNAAELAGYMQRVGRFAGRLGHLKSHKPARRAA